MIDSLPRFLIILGLVLLAVGLILVFAGKVPLIGRLPGDIYIKRDNFSFYFPLTTCILMSVLITFLIKIFNKK